MKDLHTQLAQLFRSGHSPLDPDVQRVVKTLAGLAAIKANLDGYPPRYLLQFDTDGPNGGHVVFSIGNPATAKNVTTFVPGFGSKPEKVGDGMGYAQNLTAGADQTDGTQDNATVVWLNYDAPQGFDVTSPGDAQAAAPVLSSFLATLKANNPNAHFVVEGHSYGSVVVGYAAQQPGGLRADDVILVGSPGVPANRASDFSVPDAHVYAGEMGGDPVPAAGDIAHTGVGPLGRDPVYLPGVIHFDAGHDFFDVPLRAHSKYWDLRSTALDNQLKIITGSGAPTTVSSSP